MPTLRIESIGAFFPETVLKTADLMASMVNPQPIDVEQITGIHERRVLKPEESSLLAAETAALDALKHSEYEATDIDIVISCSISRSMNGERRNYFDPALSQFIKREVGMTHAEHFDISNACGGMMTGVHLLTEMIKAGEVKNGMVVSGEQITDIMRTAAKEITEPFDPQFGSLTVGDSGAAVIIDGKGTEDDFIDYIEMTTCAEYADLCIGKPSDQNPDYALYTNNAQMHKEDRLLMWPMFHKRLLNEKDRSFEDENFDYIIQHQVGLKFVDKVNSVGAGAFKTEMPPPINSCANLGNTATTSHWIALYTHIQNNDLKPRTKVLFVPAASGLVTGCLSATLSNLEVTK